MRIMIFALLILVGISAQADIFDINMVIHVEGKDVPVLVGVESKPASRFSSLELVRVSFQYNGRGVSFSGETSNAAALNEMGKRICNKLNEKLSLASIRSGQTAEFGETLRLQKCRTALVSATLRTSLSEWSSPMQNIYEIYCK